MTSDKQRPKFSVIIPAYNAHSTIVKAIDSVLEQSYPAAEIIVVDDGSTDATAERVASYGARVKLVRQNNQGVSMARNRGAQEASGDWLTFLDADDWYYPNRLALYAQLLAQKPGLNFLTGDFDYVTPAGDHLRSSMASTQAGCLMLKQAQDGVAIMQGETLGLFIEEHFGDTHTLTLRKSTFVELGGYPQGFAVCEDVNFLIRLTAQSQRVGVVCEPTAAYLIHNNSAIRSDPLRAQQQTVAALKTLVPQLKDAPETIRKGLTGAIHRARMDLAYRLLKMNKRWLAVRAVSPLLIDFNSRSIKGFLSILKGAVTG